MQSPRLSSRAPLLLYQVTFRCALKNHSIDPPQITKADPAHNSVTTVGKSPFHVERKFVSQACPKKREKKKRRKTTWLKGREKNSKEKKQLVWIRKEGNLERKSRQIKRAFAVSELYFINSEI